MSVLPGQIRKIHDPFPPLCAHLKCTTRATHEVIGEVDSFGYESEFYCATHTNEIRTQLTQVDKSGVCDWCKVHKSVLRPHRDIDEGCSGRVYDVCQECIDKQHKVLEDELYDEEGYRR